MDLSVGDMVEIITHELQGALLRPKLDAVAARVAARHLVKRLPLRRIEWRRRPPALLHFDAGLTARRLLPKGANDVHDSD